MFSLLGTSNLKQFTAGIQVHQPLQAILHPEYNYTYYYNDVAVLKLSRNAEFTDYVRPVCLWEGSRNIENLIGKAGGWFRGGKKLVSIVFFFFFYLGTVVGWGHDENNIITDNLMQAKMPVVSLATCIFSNRDFFSKFTFDKTFCAGFRNGNVTQMFDLRAT